MSNELTPPPPSSLLKLFYFYWAFSPEEHTISCVSRLILASTLTYPSWGSQTYSMWPGAKKGKQRFSGKWAAASSRLLLDLP